MNEMSFLTEDHLRFRDNLRRFIDTEVVPKADAWEETGMVPRNDRYPDRQLYGLRTLAEIVESAKTGAVARDQVECRTDDGGVRGCLGDTRRFRSSGFDLARGQIAREGLRARRRTHAAMHYEPDWRRRSLHSRSAFS